MMGENWSHWLAIAIAVLLAVNAGLNLIGFAPLLREFERWRLPSWFRFFNAAWQGTAAVLIALPATRLLGVAMAYCVCIGVVIIVGLRAREFTHCIPALVLAAALYPVASAA